MKDALFSYVQNEDNECWFADLKEIMHGKVLLVEKHYTRVKYFYSCLLRDALVR